MHTLVMHLHGQPAGAVDDGAVRTAGGGAKLGGGRRRGLPAVANLGVGGRGVQYTRSQGAENKTQLLIHPSRVSGSHCPVPTHNWLH